MNKIALIPGHAPDSKGACSPFLPCEFDYNKKVVEEIKRLNPEKYFIFQHETYKYGYYSMVKKTADQINRTHFDLVLEFHYNSASPIANGTETLYYFASKKGKEYAQNLNEEISNCFSTKNRGIKALYNKNDRGFQAVYLVKPPALLLEPFFGSNESDCRKFSDHRKYAATVHSILNHLT